MDASGVYPPRQDRQICTVDGSRNSLKCHRLRATTLGRLPAYRYMERGRPRRPALGESLSNSATSPTISSSSALHQLPGSDTYTLRSRLVCRYHRRRFTQFDMTQLTSPHPPTFVLLDRDLTASPSGMTLFVLQASEARGASKYR